LDGKIKVIKKQRRSIEEVLQEKKIPIALFQPPPQAKPKPYERLLSRSRFIFLRVQWLGLG
jgi:hypothetical protein